MKHTRESIREVHCVPETTGGPRGVNVGDLIEVTGMDPELELWFSNGDVGEVIGWSEDGIWVDFNNPQNLGVVDDGLWCVGECEFTIRGAANDA